ncbi:carotenoid oxygenase family protein [Streptomyces sp. SPB4]|uniref:carotenoid oxygenase family protein n=1 Tax=Streptomyces TaxID=1883 RepID=UPI0024745503|nr:carotenoid oxygenase family protein [Streptomyces sp. SPB4]MDH6540336.1 carotenoid cleavage dioxygenase-like enzyme [Streptomyces sp. SPB4]
MAPTTRTTTRTTANRYLSGSFAPVTEETTAHDLPVTGRIPGHLSGRYLRTGPNPLGIEDAAAHLWTLGEGMVHGVRIRDGRAEWYRNRWVRSASVADRLGEPRRGGPVDERTDFAPNVQVAGLAGRTFALIEGGLRPYELTYDLDTIGPCDLGATPEGYNANAHSLFDPRTRELHSLAFRYGSEHVQHIVMDDTGTVLRATTVHTPGSPYMHDFALTDHHVLLFDAPVVFSAAHLATGVPFSWDHTHPARVGVMPRAGGPVRWFPVTPGLVGHTLNAHENGTDIVVDLVRHPEGFDIRDFGTSRPTLDRWTVDLVAGTVREERLDDRTQEFPRINSRYTGLPHRYGYAAAVELYAPPAGPGDPRPDEGFSNALLKHDLSRGTTEAHEFGRFAAVGEGVFVPAETPTAEDDGYVMAYVHSPERGAADLVILSAQDFTGEPLARIHLPVRVPLGLHGNWVPDGGPAARAPGAARG